MDHDVHAGMDHAGMAGKAGMEHAMGHGGHGEMSMADMAVDMREHTLRIVLRRCRDGGMRFVCAR